MGAEIDSLDIRIAANAQRASQSLNTLINRLDKVNSSLSRAGGSGMVSMSIGVTRLANAMQAMNAVGTADFTRLTKNIEKLSTIKSVQLHDASVALTQMSKSITSLSGTNAGNGAKQIETLANGIKQLGYSSSSKAIENIPKLAVAMKDLMSTLSTAPKVSQNLIDMTNALAKLARTGASSGRAASSLSNMLNTYSGSSKKAKKHTFSLSAAIGKLYATYWLLFRAMGKIGDSINIASDLVEVQNVVDTTFGKYSSLVDKMASTSIVDFGMSELTVKKISSRFQAMGTAMGFTQGKMAEMSVSLTELAADMASFYNVEQADVAQSLESIFTGETRPLRTYGLDLTEATLKEWALKQGLDANVSSMSQAEKAMLRYQYVMENTGAAQGDFARTAGTWSNQVRILRQNFEQLGAVLGGTLINALTPLIRAFNSAMNVIIAFAETISNALGKIFGWQFQRTGGGATDTLTDGLDGVSDAAGGAAGNIGGATDAAKELKKELLSFDEITKLSDVTDTSGGGGGSGGGGTSGGTASGAEGGEWTQVDTLFDSYKSNIDSLYELGHYISSTLQDAMDNIEWDKIQEKAKSIGEGLADFLNGAIYEQIGATTGSTIAEVINTVFTGSKAFSDRFNWEELGKTIGSSINSFFTDFDFGLAAESFNSVVTGILDAAIAAMDTTDFVLIGEKIGGFIDGIEWDTILKKVGETIWKAINGALTVAWEIFDEYSIETTITTAILGLKFLKLGTSIGSLIWGKIKTSVTGKMISDVYSRTIGTSISDAVTGGVTTAVEKDSFKTAISNSLGTSINSALGIAGVYVGIVSIANAIQSFSEKVKGGNGELSEMGGIMDSISNSFAPDLRDKIFELKESLEDSGASTDEFAEAFTELFRNAGVSAEALTTAYNNVAGSINTTVEQENVLKTVIDNLSDSSEKMSKKVKESGTIATHSYSAIKDALVKMQEGVIPSNDHMISLLGVLDEQAASGATTSESIKAVSEALEIMGISAEDASKYLSGIPEEVSVEAVMKVKNRKKDLQKTVNKFYKDLYLESGVEVKTKPEEVQSRLNEFTHGWKMPFDTEIATTTDQMKAQINSKLWGLTFGILTEANVSKLNDKIDVSKKYLNDVSAYTTGIKWQSGANKNMTVKAETSKVGWSSGADKDMNVSAQTKQVSWATNASKWISGLLGYVKEVQKDKSVGQLILKGITGFISNLFGSGAQKADGGLYKNGKWSPITAYAGGGLPNMGELFVARESGPELVGRMGGGTAVMNNNQIVSSVSAGVYQAVVAAMNQFSGGQVAEVHVHLEGDAEGVFRLVKSVNDNIVISTGNPALLT